MTFHPTDPAREKSLKNSKITFSQVKITVFYFHPTGPLGIAQMQAWPVRPSHIHLGCVQRLRLNAKKSRSYTGVLGSYTACLPVFRMWNACLPCAPDRTTSHFLIKTI